MKITRKQIRSLINEIINKDYKVVDKKASPKELITRQFDFHVATLERFLLSGKNKIIMPASHKRLSHEEIEKRSGIKQKGERRGYIYKPKIEYNIKHVIATGDYSNNSKNKNYNLKKEKYVSKPAAYVTIIFKNQLSGKDKFFKNFKDVVEKHVNSKLKHSVFSNIPNGVSKLVVSDFIKSEKYPKHGIEFKIYSEKLGEPQDF